MNLGLAEALAFSTLKGVEREGCFTVDVLGELTLGAKVDSCEKLQVESPMDSWEKRIEGESPVIV